MIIFMFTLQYIFMVLHLFKHLESIWKPALLYLIILTVWGVIRMGTIIYEDEKKLWSGRFYTRIVTCIGHTEINTRCSTSCSLNIPGGGRNTGEGEGYRCCLKGSKAPGQTFVRHP